MKFGLYLVKCKDETLYCGITSNLEKRIKEHNEGRRGAKYTRSRRPVFVVFFQFVCCKSRALKLEFTVKKLNRIKKNELIEGKINLESLKKADCKCSINF
jgi:putative endonuclease